MLLHWLFRKNLSNVREFWGQIVYPPPPSWQKIARTPMMKFYEMGISKPQVMLVETTQIQHDANPSATFPIYLPVNCTD